MALDLNEKPWYVALLIGLVIGGVLFWVMNTYYFKPMRADIAELDESITGLEREIEKGRAAQRDLPKLEEEIRNLELELDRLKKILPTQRETDNLLKKLKQLTEIGHFQLQRFTPQKFVDRDFYLEWPIQVNLQGTYHELGLFFDRLSRFSRIINVGSLTVTGNRNPGFTITAAFTQRTFIYKEEGTTAEAAR